MREPYRQLENSLDEISRCAGRILHMLEEPYAPSPARYVDVVRMFRSISGAWSRHLELSFEFNRKIVDENQAVRKQLAEIQTAPWPRSTSAGLQSIRISGANTLRLLLLQIEAERALLIPAIREAEGAAELVAW